MMTTTFEKEGREFTAENVHGVSRAEFESATLAALIDEGFITSAEVDDLRARIDGAMSLFSNKPCIHTIWKSDNLGNSRWYVPRWNTEETIEEFLTRRDKWIDMYILSKVLFDEECAEYDEDSDHEFRSWTYEDGNVYFEMKEEWD